MTLATIALAITLAITNPKGKPLTVGFAPLKIQAWVTTAVEHVRKGELCIESAHFGRSCRSLEDTTNPGMWRQFTLRESDLFVATIKWEDDQGQWHYEESKLMPVEIPVE